MSKHVAVINYLSFNCNYLIKICIRLWNCIYSIAYYILGSVHRNSILIRSNQMQQYAGIYLLQNHSTCLGCPSHPSSGVHKTVNAASGTGRSIWATTFLQRGQIWPRLSKVVAQILLPVPEAAFSVLCTPDDGCNGHPKHVEGFAVNKYLHTVTSCWILLIYILLIVEYNGVVSPELRRYTFKGRNMSH